MRNLVFAFIFSICTLNLAAQDYYYAAKKANSNGDSQIELFFSDGKPVFNKSYDWVFVNHWKWIFTKENGLYTAYSPSGEPLNISGIQTVHNVWTVNNLIPLMKDSLYGYYDRKGKLQIRHQYNDITLFKNEKAAVKRDGETFYINKKGKRLTEKYEPNKDYVFMNMYGAIGMFGFSNWPQEEFEQNGKVGLRDKKTKEIILPAVFDGLFNMRDFQVTVGINGQYGVIDFNRKMILPIIYDEIYVLE